MFRAVCDFDGSDSINCISLICGDQLSAVHVLDDTWYIGFNERSKQTGAFPSAYVELEEGNTYTPFPAINASTEGLLKQPVYVNVSKQIQEGNFPVTDDKTDILTNISTGDFVFSANKLRKTKPKRTFKIKEVKNAENVENNGAKAEEIFSKSDTSRSVRFDGKSVEQYTTIPNSITNWPDSYVEESFPDQISNYEGYFTDKRQDKNNTNHKKKTSDGTYHRFGKLHSFKSSTENLLKSSKDEKRGIKSVIGIISGLVIGSLMFLVYHYSSGYTLVEAGILASILTVLFCVGMALSSLIRCIMALVVPNFFTGIGRGILLSAIFALILKHPVSNISFNAKETGSSMACIVELAANQTRILHRQLAVPLNDISEYVEQQKQSLKSTTKELNSTFSSVHALFKELGEGAATAEEALNLLKKKCLNTVNSIKNECNQKCKLFQKLCKPCQNLDYSATCAGLNIDVYLNGLAKKIQAALKNTINYFEVDIVINADFSGSSNVSKPTEAIQAEVEEDIGGKLRTFDNVISVIGKCLSLSLFLIFIQSFWYLRNYLAKDGYDNIYITRQFKELDKEAERNGRETVLPLKKREEKEYVITSSLKLNSTELGYSKLGLIQVLLHILLCILVITFDYALYYILDLVKEYGDIELEVESRGRMKIEVQGSGPTADFYRLLVKGYNLNKSFNMTLDIESCLPDPREPSVAMIPVFIILYVIALAVVLLRAYGMRLRRKVSAYYCPEQELARLDYLHKKLRHKRVGFLKFLRQQIKSAHKEEQVKSKLRFSTWLSFNFPFIAQLLPQKTKLECTSCGQRETSFSNVKLTKCTGRKGGVQCDATYCGECYTALQKICPLCSSDDTVVLRE